MDNYNIFDDQYSSYIGDFRGATLLDSDADPFYTQDQQQADISAVPSAPNLHSESQIDNAPEYGSHEPQMVANSSELMNVNQQGFSPIATVPNGGSYGGFDLNDNAQYAPIINQPYTETQNPYVASYGGPYFTDAPPQERRRSSGPPLVVKDVHGNWHMVPRSQMLQYQAELSTNEHSQPSSRGTPGAHQQLMVDEPSSSVSPQPQHFSKRKTKTSNFAAQNPKRDYERPWVRTNGRNKVTGSTRTGKIVQYNPGKAYEAPNKPCHGPWVGAHTNKMFEYNSYGELKELKYTAAELEDYILKYNPGTDVPLKIWIQKAPADSARRQPTSGSSKCRLAECPAVIYGSTITVGSFRLAFDEQWHLHEHTKDPHVCAGFVHLYCAERFMNLRQIAMEADLEPDERHFPTEPNGKFAASLAQMQAADDARDFIHAARGTGEHAFDFDTQWPNYPAAPHPQSGFEPLHKYTLGYRMFLSKIEGMNQSKLKMLQDRGVKKSNQLSHFGDVEKATRSRKGATEKRRRAIQGLNDSSESDEPDQPPARRTKRATSKTPNETHIPLIQTQPSITSTSQPQPRIQSISSISSNPTTITYQPQPRRLKSPLLDTMARSDSISLHSPSGSRVNSQARARMDSTASGKTDLTVPSPTGAVSPRRGSQGPRQLRRKSTVSYAEPLATDIPVEADAKVEAAEEAEAEEEAEENQAVAGEASDTDSLFEE